MALLRQKESMIPLMTKIISVVALVQAIIAIGAYMTTTFENPLPIILMAIAGLALAAGATFAWGTLGELRRTARIVLTSIVALPVVIGVFCAVYTALANPSTDAMLNLCMATKDTPVSYIFLFDVSLTAAYAQILLMFFLPAVALTTSFGYRSDRIWLRVMTAVQALMMAFNVLYSSPQHQIPLWDTANNFMPTWHIAPLNADLTIIQLILLGISVLLAVLTWLPFGTKRKSAEQDGA